MQNNLLWGLLRTPSVVSSEGWHPLGGLQPAQGVPAPFHGHLSDLLLCPTAHGALLGGCRWGTSSKHLGSCAFPRRHGSRQEPARRWSRDVVDKFSSYFFQAFSLTRDSRLWPAHVAISFGQVRPGCGPWGDSWWCPEPEQRLQALRSLFLNFLGSKLPVAEPPTPVHPFSLLAPRSLNFPHCPKKCHLLSGVPCLLHSSSCPSPAGFLPTTGKQSAQMSIKPTQWCFQISASTESTGKELQHLQWRLPLPPRQMQTSGSQAPALTLNFSALPACLPAL